MRQFMFAAVATSAMAGFAACASSGASGETPSTPTTTRVVGPGGQNISFTTDRSPATSDRLVIDAPLDRVWTELVAVYGELGIPLTTMVTAERRLGNDDHRVRRQLGGVRLTAYFDCGGTPGAPNAETYVIRLSIFSRLTPADDGGTALTTTIDANASNPRFADRVVQCSSNGALENRIQSRVAERSGM